MIITIKQIKHEKKISQNTGKEFESCQILATNSQNKDVWINGFGSNNSHTWEIGDSVDLTLTQIEKNGKTYWNFTENSNTKPSPDKKLKLLQEIDRKLDLLIGSKTTLKPESGTTYQFNTESYSQGQTSGNNEVIDMNIVVEDLPF